jgi:PAS domain S-box-containing protein
MIGFVGQDLRMELVNRHWERTMGWQLEELRSQNIDVGAVFYPDPLERQRVHDSMARADGQWEDFRTTIRDGRVIDTSWAVVRLSDGATVCIGQDVSRRKTAEREVGKQKDLLETIFDHIPVMIGFIGQNQQMELVNREAERTLGWSLEELRSPGIDIGALFYPDPMQRQRVQEVIARADGEWVDLRTTIKDGRVIDASWAAVRTSDGDTVCIGQDVSLRKQAERELRKQKDILQTIFDHIPVMISFSERDLEPKLINRECERTLGWSLEEIVRDKVDVLAELYPDPEYREQVLDFMLHSNGEWRDFKTRVREGRVIDGSWVRLVLPDGSILRMGQDVTSRKRAEEALRESEERFRQLTENIRDLFWIKTPDLKRAIYFSPSYETISGRSREEAYQAFGYLNFLKRVVPEDRERMAQFMERPVEADFEIEYRITHPDGSVHWVCDRGFPIRDQAGKIYRVAGIIHDITEGKLAEKALRESEERFRQLTENIHEVFWLRSPDLRQLLYLSPVYERVYGQSIEAAYAKGVDLDMLHPEDRSRVVEMIENFQAREFEIEYRIVIPATGEVRWLRDRGFPIRNQAGQIYRIGGVAEDITDRKQAEQRLEASSEQLRALSASLQSAREKEATRIAHQIHDELGGVLTGLKWELETLDKMIHQPADPGRLKSMEDKLAVMATLTDTTIDAVRRIASELRPSILDDLGLVEAVEWQTQQFQARAGIECHCDCSLQSIPLNDRQCTTLFRIVQEALTNILRHAQATRVAVALKVVDDILELTVSDNGRGITPAETQSKKSLGLLGMRERAHLIGGRLDITGLPGVGTTVQVRAPLEGAAG